MNFITPNFEFLLPGMKYSGLVVQNSYGGKPYLIKYFHILYFFKLKSHEFTSQIEISWLSFASHKFRAIHRLA